jgi:hypothetical protein
MANKLVKGKPVVKKPATIKTDPNGAVVTNDGVSSARSGETTRTRDVFNAETAQVLRDADAGKNLTRSVDEDDLFRKLGIKLGKA